MENNVYYTSKAKELNKVLSNQVKALDTYANNLDTIGKLLTDIEGSFKVGMNNYIDIQKDNIVECQSRLNNIITESNSNAEKLDSERNK